MNPPAHQPELTTARLVLRPLAEPDRAAFIELETASRTRFAHHSPATLPGKTLDGYFDRQLARSGEYLRPGTGMRRAVFLLGGGKLVGHVNLSDIVRGVSHRCNLGWRVHAEHVRRGCAREAVSAVLQQVLATESHGGPALHRAECAIQPGNTPSLRLALSLGFRVEGFALR